MSRLPARSSAAIAATLLLLASLPLGVRAGTMTGGATEWTQLMNNVALLQQVVQAIRMVVSLKKQIEYWKQSVAQLKSPQDALNIFRGFQDVLSSTQRIVFAGQSLKDRWAELHPGLVDPHKNDLTDEDAYHRVDEGVRKAVDKTMAVLDVQNLGTNGAAKDKQVFQALQTKMQTVNGQVEAIMMSNELLLEILRQLHRLRDVATAHANMMGEAVSSDSQRRQYDDAIRHRDWTYTGSFRSRNAIDFSKRR